MTQKEFLDRLRKTPRTWRILCAPKGRLRNNARHCPLQAVLGPQHYIGAGLSAGLPVNDIVAAGDGRTKRSDEKKWRRVLLRACAPLVKT